MSKRAEVSMCLGMGIFQHNMQRNVLGFKKDSTGTWSWPAHVQMEQTPQNMINRAREEAKHHLRNVSHHPNTLKNINHNPTQLSKWDSSLLHEQYMIYDISWYISLLYPCYIPFPFYSFCIPKKYPHNIPLRPAGEAYGEWTSGWLWWWSPRWWSPSVRCRPAPRIWSGRHGFPRGGIRGGLVEPEWKKKGPGILWWWVMYG